MFKNTSSILLVTLLLNSFQAMTASEKQEEIIAPAGLSLPAAFKALYNNASPLRMGYLHPQVGSSLHDDQHAMQVFLTTCNHGFSSKCDYVRGKPIKTNFSSYPKLDVTEYNRHHGKGKAQTVLENAARENKFDTTIYSKDICSYFQGVSSQDGVDPDVLNAFVRCQRFKDAEQKVTAYKAAKSPFLGAVLNRCVAAYTIRSGLVNQVPHNYKPCEDALSHMRLMQEDSLSYGRWIEGLSVCKQYSCIPIRTGCMDLDQASLDSSAQLLEHAMEKKS